MDVDVEDGSGLIVNSDSLSVRLFTFAIVTMVFYGRSVELVEGKLPVAEHVTLVKTLIVSIPGL